MEISWPLRVPLSASRQARADSSSNGRWFYSLGYFKRRSTDRMGNAINPSPDQFKSNQSNPIQSNPNPFVIGTLPQGNAFFYVIFGKRRMLCLLLSFYYRVIPNFYASPRETDSFSGLGLAGLLPGAYNATPPSLPHMPIVKVVFWLPKPGLPALAAGEYEY